MALGLRRSQFPTKCILGSSGRGQVRVELELRDIHRAENSLGMRERFDGEILSDGLCGKEMLEKYDQFKF